LAGGTVAANGENGFLAAGFHPPVIHAFSIRTRLGTRLRVCGEQLLDCWARLKASCQRPGRVYGTQAEMYASATAPPRDQQAPGDGGQGSSSGAGGGAISSSSSDSPPYMPAESPRSSYRHHHQPTPPSRRDCRDLAV
jgi:hypothetical protein